MTSHLLTVSQLTSTIKKILETGFSTLHIQGEISNFKQQSSGHCYFSLKDENASIACVMFYKDAIRLKTPLKNGESVAIKGSLTVYPQSGKYQILVKEVQKTGVGELLLRLEELKVKLHKKGWFKQGLKKKLPKMPKRIGIVTSPTGAAVRDILKVLGRRFSGLHIYLNPVRVQGDGAAKEIAKAILEFNRFDLVDVMIVGRGGGSIEDLFAFNEERVAEAIFESKIPIICAVGHETDHCIAEYVADARAPTPSAAAEMVVAEKIHYEKALQQMQVRLTSHIRIQLRSGLEKLKSLLKQPKLRNPSLLIQADWQKLDDVIEGLDSSFLRKLQHRTIQLLALKSRLLSLKPTTRLNQIKEKIIFYRKIFQRSIFQFLTKKQEALILLNEQINASQLANFRLKKMDLQLLEKQKKVDSAINRLIILKKQKLDHCRETLGAINPKKLLAKGFTILFSEKDGSVINSVQALHKSENFRLLFKDGEAVIRVENIIPNKV